MDDQDQDHDNVEVMTWTVTIDHSCAPTTREMRKHRTAPVDSMGCERAHDDDAEPQVRRFPFFYQIIKINKIEVLNVCVILCLRQVSMSSQSDDVKPDQR